MAIFEIKFSVYKQASRQTNKQTNKQPPRRHSQKISRSALLSAAGATKKQSFTDSIHIFNKVMTKYSHKKCTKTFHIWKNKNVNKTHCFYSETVLFRKKYFRNGTKLLPKCVNKQLRPNIQIVCLTYSC